MAGKRVTVKAGHGFQFFRCNDAREVFVEKGARQVDRSG
jgi:hypothetical protein